MRLDFCSYESNRFLCDQCYELLAGESKETSRKIVVATWAMLLRQPKEWFKQFSMLVVDEAHQADSMALKTVINSMAHVAYRFGFTGTLDGSKTHELQCRAFFGTLIESSTTKELMDVGILSNLEIVFHSLKYPDHYKQVVKGAIYRDEIDFIVSNQKRNEMIVDMALNQPKNTLVLFNLVEKHGKVLFDMAKSAAEKKGKKVFFISGETDVDTRQRIRQTMENNNNVVLFASFGTLAVGVNIKNLHSIIFAHPYKARIRTLQSIGRSLRRLSGKDKAVLVDFMDDLSYNTKHMNFALKHAIERLKIYESEGFKVSFSSTDLG